MSKRFWTNFLGIYQTQTNFVLSHGRRVQTIIKRITMTGLSLFIIVAIAEHSGTAVPVRSSSPINNIVDYHYYYYYYCQQSRVTGGRINTRTRGPIVPADRFQRSRWRNAYRTPRAAVDLSGNCASATRTVSGRASPVYKRGRERLDRSVYYLFRLLAVVAAAVTTHRVPVGMFNAYLGGRFKTEIKL